MTKPNTVEFRDTSLDDLRAFLANARRDAGYRIDQVQQGGEPDDWKPMKTVGQSVKEIRIQNMSTQKFSSVWDAIENTQEEAENMKLRSVLMMAIKNHITHTGMNQAEAAKLLGVTQPRVSDLMRGKINLFSLDALVNMTTAVGLRIEMRVFEAA